MPSATLNFERLSEGLTGNGIIASSAVQIAASRGIGRNPGATEAGASMRLKASPLRSSALADDGAFVGEPCEETEPGKDQAQKGSPKPTVTLTSSLEKPTSARK